MIYPFLQPWFSSSLRKKISIGYHEKYWISPRWAAIGELLDLRAAIALARQARNAGISRGSMVKNKFFRLLVPQC